MNLFDLLKQFKQIEPDAGFSATSKRAILATTPNEPSIWTARRTIFRFIETGAAVALTVFFIILITGGLSNSIAPVRFSAIDPQGLKAEAQAIDMQIELANLRYSAPLAESTTPTAPGVPSKNAESTKATSTTPSFTLVPGSTDATSSNASSSNVSVDQVLQGLSE